MDKILEICWKCIEWLVHYFLVLTFKIIRKELTNNVEQAFLQFVQFGIVGLSNTILSYVINIVVLLAVSGKDLSWDYLLGNTIAFVISVAWSFYWNNKYVFVLGEGQQRNIVVALIKTYVSYAFTGIILANVLSYVWISMLGISKYIAPLMNLIISVPLNYIINKLWAFKSK